MSNKYVNLMWSEYYSLQDGTTSRIWNTKEETEAASDSYLDVIYGPLAEDEAHELVRAMNAKASADWTPNQSPDERERNKTESDEASAIIAKYQNKAI